MSGERASKVRKTRRNDTVDKPDTVVEMAEPIKEPEEESGKNRLRQLSVDEVPFEFLSWEKKEEILKQKRLEEEAEAERELKNAQSSKKAKALLGIFIGAGIGMWAAYLFKEKLFSPTVAAAIESVSDIVEKSTD